MATRATTTLLLVWDLALHLAWIQPTTSTLEQVYDQSCCTLTIGTLAVELL